MTAGFHRQLMGLAGALLAIVWLVQDGAGENRATTLPVGKRSMIWVDLSDSVPAPQRQTWLGGAESIIKGLGSGDSIEAYGVHEATLGAAPLARGHLPLLSENATLPEQIGWHKARGALREQLRTALTQAFNRRSSAQRTDLFGALDRFKPDDRGRPTVLYFFSDMLHVTAELNMEKTPLAPHMQSLVDKVLSRHDWPQGLLNGTTVHCILPGMRGTSGVNSRQVLERFWGRLFQLLGAHLATFETHITTS